MKHALSLAALAAVSFSLPAFAADEPQSAAADKSASAFTEQLSLKANADQVRKLLKSQNYSSISPLNRDENGRWTGTALKDGQRIVVSVYLPRNQTAPVTN